MQNILWLLRWILKAAIFFTLFAFALNNQHEVTAHFFFGNEWKAPLVVMVLIAFTAGVVIGVLGMLPRWWLSHKALKRPAAPSVPSSTPDQASPASVLAHSRAQDGSA